MERKKTSILKFDELTKKIQEISARLELASGPGAPKKFALKSKTVIGAADGDIVIDDPYLSRRHFEIELEPVPVITDLGSTNGTFVNGVRVERAALEDGALINAGTCNFVFTISLKQEKLSSFESTNFLGIIAKSEIMREIFSLTERIAPTDLPVLIVGETGVGKELVARAIHQLSKRAGSFIPVNCGAITNELVESELFGHEKGAFTGADRSRAGLFELADGGTIMLDEIADLPAELQSRLLRVIETGEMRRVGSSHFTNVDARVIAATNRDLKAEMEAGKFRKDLFFRLSAITVRIPPLHDRKEDIQILTEHFINEFSRKFNLPAKSIAQQVLEKLESYDWPGNVRELRHVVELAFILSRQNAITPDAIEFKSAIRSSKELPVLDLEKLESIAIREALKRANGVKRRAAMLLGISPSTLAEKLKRYGIDDVG